MKRAAPAPPPGIAERQKDIDTAARFFGITALVGQRMRPDDDKNPSA